MKTSFRLAGLGLTFLAAAGAFADTASTTSTTTSATTTATRPAHGDNVSMGQFCSGGGSRTVTGGLDSTTGALDVTTTYAACKTQRGDLIDGTAKSSGSIVAGTGTTAINVTTAVSMKTTRSDGTSFTRTCTATKVGTFSTAQQTFTGKTTRSNCVVDGVVREHEGLAEHLLRPSISDDETGGLDVGVRL